MEIVLGGAQFGQAYGITNQDGRVDSLNAKNIIAAAIASNIKKIDTAQLYGDSETVIGETLLDDIEIITKFQINTAHDNLETMMETSLNHLHRDSVYGVMVHNADILKNPEIGRSIMAQFESLKDKGKLQKVGVSVYDPETLIFLLDQYNFDMVQFPCNVFDQRFIQEDVQRVLDQHHIEQYARSIFLQGLLLSTIDDLPDFLNTKQDPFLKYFKWREDHNLSPLEGCLAFVKWLHDTKRIELKPVIGMTNQDQLNDLIVSRENVLSSDIKYDFTDLATNEMSVIDPRQWK